MMELLSLKEEKENAVEKISGSDHVMPLHHIMIKQESPHQMLTP